MNPPKPKPFWAYRGEQWRKGVKVGSRVWTLVVHEVAVASPSFGVQGRLPESGVGRVT